MQEYILELLLLNKDALAKVRLVHGLKIAEDGSRLWLRGIPFTAYLDKELWQLPLVKVYCLDKDNYLFPLAGTVPVAKLPELTWIPLRQYLPVKAPVSAIKGEIKDWVTISLVSSKTETRASALLVQLNDWAEYVETAAQTRLKKLSFAISKNKSVMIMGEPLPPMPGKEYWRVNNLLLPSGYCLEPAIAAELLPQKLDPDNRNIIVFDSRGDWQKIDCNDFVNATRSAVRFSVAAIKE